MIERIYKLIDWFLQLPPDLEDAVWLQVQEIEEERRMAYLTYAERRGLAEGRAEGRTEGLHEAISVAIEARFAGASASLVAEIDELTDPALLRAIMARVMTAATPDEVRAVYRSGE